jgi:molybdopterin-guanine dinucleotide biosynthesis protein A
MEQIDGGWPGCAVVILAGGEARRMGHDKLSAPLAPVDGTVLDVVLAGVPDGLAIALVGPPRQTRRPVLTAREDPPGGGPAAGVAAGFAALTQAGRLGPRVVVLAGDAPFGPAAVPALLTAMDVDTFADVAVAVDPDGHVQPLLAVYQSPALLHQVTGGLAGRPARALLDGLTVRRVRVPAEAALDVDTPADLERARRTVLRRHPACRGGAS